MNLDNGKLQLVGCGIFCKEIHYLIEKNHWTIATDFLPASLHINLKQLSAELQQSLEQYRDEQTIVFYGACHPRMESFLEQAHTIRTLGQNCVAMLLGEQEFQRELAEGAFFLLDDWAKNWDEITFKTFGSNLDIIRDIFHDHHRYLLALRTPCSHDYTSAANQISEMLDLPLRWLDVGLEQLETVLQNAIQRKLDATNG